VEETDNNNQPTENEDMKTVDEEDKFLNELRSPNYHDCCANCRFYEILDTDSKRREINGTCQRHAPFPRVYPERELSIKADDVVYWPYVNWVEWCGEHQRVTSDNEKPTN